MLYLYILLSLIGALIAIPLLICLSAVIQILLVNVNKPPKDTKFFRTNIKIVLKILVPLLKVKIHATGLDKVPRDSRFLLVSNHLFDLDPAIFMYCLPDSELAFVGKKEIYKDMKFISKAMHKLHGLPIDRENNRSAILTIGKATENIKNDIVSMAIFPEGFCSLTGELLPFRNGAFKIAKKAKCPIVVGTLKNTRAIGKNYLRRTTHVYLDILDVVPADTVNELSTAELGDKIHKMMSDNLN